ncbi:PLCZ1 [Acrasis kona]|uniref:PLCZ1 n=1 Tax=Acrasis kona TaxID=1008807 RepID=A0AAW2YTA1_9EUKA
MLKSLALIPWKIKLPVMIAGVLSVQYTLEPILRKQLEKKDDLKSKVGTPEYNETSKSIAETESDVNKDTKLNKHGKEIRQDSTQVSHLSKQSNERGVGGAAAAKGLTQSNEAGPGSANLN